MEVATESISQLVLAFFGLTFEKAPEVRNQLFQQIHQIVFHSNGGYDWNTVYNMPIWLRAFTFNEMKKHYKEENDSISKPNSPNSSNKTALNKDGKVVQPDFFKNPPNNKKSISYK